MQELGELGILQVRLREQLALRRNFSMRTAVRAATWATSARFGVPRADPMADAHSGQDASLQVHGCARDSRRVGGPEAGHDSPPPSGSLAGHGAWLHASAGSIVVVQRSEEDRRTPG
jgi:hypothetical protein